MFFRKYKSNKINNVTYHNGRAIIFHTSPLLIQIKDMEFHLLECLMVIEKKINHLRNFHKIECWGNLLGK